VTTDLLVLNASNLPSKWGFWDGAAPDELAYRFFDLPADDPLSAENPHAIWCRWGLLNDLVHTLLLPRVPLALDLYTIGSHNPIRTRRVGDLIQNPDTDQWDDVNAAMALLEPYSASIAIPAVIDYVRHRDAWFEGGGDPAVLLLGLALGMSVEEVQTGTSDSSVTYEGLRTLYALHG
jgi:hypothetical protein